jgi:methyl-accepting chemotaxis protein
MEMAVLGGVLSLTLIAMACGTLVFSVRKFNRPIKQMLLGIQEMSLGNLRPTFPSKAPGELGEINEALIAMGKRLSDTLSQLNGLSRQVQRTTSGAESSFSEVKDGIGIQSQVAARTFDAVGQIVDGLSSASTEIEDMAQRISSSASRLSDVDRIIAHLAESIGQMTSIISEVSRSSKQGDDNVRVLAKDLGDLTQQVHTANLALNDMASAAEKARADAADTAFFMGNLTLETERIGAAIEATIEGSDAIHTSNERILDVTASLQSRVNRVDDVLDVVHNLAERTKLLSINASIIASEAGEHGRAFAVVAREVKELAQSTATAIAEISVVLKGLKEGFAQTVKTIQSGQEDVDRGVRLARNAVVLLRSIPDKVRQAAVLSSEIAARNAAQVNEGTEVKNIVNRVVATIKQINVLLEEQIARNGHTLKLFDTINHTADLVLKSTTDHAQASQNVNQTVDVISADFRTLAEKVRTNIQGLGNIVKLSEQVLTITDSNRRRADELSGLISDLHRYVADLGLNA